MQNILLVEDDAEISNLISLHLNPAQYSLTSCSSGLDALENFSKEKFNLVMLDIGLPDSNGMEICKKIRLNDRQTPIMMLTCHNDESDKVLALELGADDYITKPFGILELLARIKAVMRRSSLQQNEDHSILYHKDLVIDPAKRKAGLGEVRLDLTVKEFDLLWLLASNPGKTFSRKELLEKVWGFSFSGYEHTVTSHINRLRLKLETNLNDLKYILTSWGTGYRFSE